MSDSAAPIETLLELESRHDDLLRRLAVLDQEVERVLHNCLGSRATTAEAAAID